MEKLVIKSSNDGPWDAGAQIKVHIIQLLIYLDICSRRHLTHDIVVHEILILILHAEPLRIDAIVSNYLAVDLILADQQVRLLLLAARGLLRRRLVTVLVVGSLLQLLIVLQRQIPLV